MVLVLARPPVSAVIASAAKQSPAVAPDPGIAAALGPELPVSGRHASMLATAIEGNSSVATLVIRNVDDAIHNRLKALAASHGRSMEEEARLILRDRLATAPCSPPANWVDAVRALFEPLGGLELPQVSREPPREPLDLSGPEWNPPA